MDRKIYELDTFAEDRRNGIWKNIGIFTAEDKADARRIAEGLAAFLGVPCGWREQPEQEKPNA